ncbi:MAG: DegT/DnrJ/EryC1/StrS family aminotransferase [bacterium]|nr:DegT/DnrJ/EryC1/StrS family aminotransferase [bacterium]
MSELAINGGKPVRGRDRLFPVYNPIGVEEKTAVMRVLDSGVLSQYIGVWHPDFYGGPEVKAFEKEWAEKFCVKHAVAMNSATSCLIAAVGALGIRPGDEVIVSPYTMVASVSCILWYGGVPVFADVEPEYFCLDPKSVEAAITPRTKAIVVVDLFGGAYDADAICTIAKKHNLKIIEDAAQAPGASYKGKKVGTLGDIGVYSLNFHKHIHTGEGGVAVTDDDALAERLQLIRNHAEAVVEAKGVKDLTNMVGQNYRLTEIQAAIGREQLKKLDALVAKRRENCAYIAARTRDMPGLAPAPERPQSEHVFYMQPFLYDEKVVGIPRARFVEALLAELPDASISGGYVKPIYRMPLFGQVPGLCPTAERLYGSELLLHEMMYPGLNKKDLDDVVEAFHKVYRHRGEL